MLIITLGLCARVRPAGHSHLAAAKLARWPTNCRIKALVIIIIIIIDPLDSRAGQ